VKKALFLVACLLCFALGSFSTLAAMQWSQRIPSSATVKAVGVGIYKDVNFTVSVTQINWGIVEAGESKNFSAYIVNQSNVPITLSMTTEAWNPANASDFITLSWNYSGAEIAVGSYAFVDFVLNVSQTITGVDAFSFTIIVTGSG
jgi:hypothetical protein